MSDIYYDSGSGSLTLRDNYWDTNVLKLNVMEIVDWSIPINRADTFVQGFSSFLSKSLIEMCLLRLPLEEKELLYLFQKRCNFLFIETSLKISLDNASRELIQNHKLIGRTHIRKMKAEDLPQVEKIATSVFNHGRYAEDTHISPNSHRLRQKKWIHALAKSPENILVSTSPAGIMSFMAYKKISETHIELILGGSVEGQAFAGVFFWHDIMAFFVNSGIRRIDTVVSAANISIVRLYESLGFKVTKSFAGLHWYCNNISWPRPN